MCVTIFPLLDFLLEVLDDVLLDFEVLDFELLDLEVLELLPTSHENNDLKNTIYKDAPMLYASFTPN